MKNLNTYVIEGLADWGDDDKLDKKNIQADIRIHN